MKKYILFAGINGACSFFCFREELHNRLVHSRPKSLLIDIANGIISSYKQSADKSLGRFKLI